jgi:flagellar hook-associated protein 3 FlgL
MRIATNSYTDQMLNQFSVLKSQLGNLQNQVSTGLRVQSPSDDPAAMQTTLTDLTSQATQQQYSSNISTVQSQANTVYSVLQQLQIVTSQAQTIATSSAGDATKSQTDLNNYATSVKSLIQQALQLVNTKDPATGQYLFGGTSSGQPPFVATTDANGNVTGVTYQGNSSVNQTEIADGVTVGVTVPGANSSGSGAYGLITDSRTGADLFNHLIALQTDLTAGNKTAISGTDATNLAGDANNVTYQVAYNGNVQTQLTTAASFASNQATSLTGLITNASGADLVQTMTELSQTQTAYQAALQSSATIMQLSILNFLS